MLVAASVFLSIACFSSGWLHMGLFIFFVCRYLKERICAEKLYIQSINPLFQIQSITVLLYLHPLHFCYKNKYKFDQTGSSLTNNSSLLIIMLSVVDV